MTGDEQRDAHSSPVEDPLAVRTALQPILDLDLLKWHGLPAVTASTLQAALGPSSRSEAVRLGRFPARKETYPIESRSGGLAAYVRDEGVLLVETLVAPPISVIEGLEPPTAIMPHEVLDDHGYVHEYLYAQRGLVLGIAEPFDKTQPLKIVRCRGFHPIRDAADFGPDLYMPFEDRISYEGR